MRKTLRVRVELLDDGEPVASAGKSVSFEGQDGDCFTADGFAEALAYTLRGLVSLGVSPPVECVLAAMIDMGVQYEGASPDFQPVADAALDYLADRRKEIEDIIAQSKGGKP